MELFLVVFECCIAACLIDNSQRLASQWTVPKTIHALLVTSGKLDAAERYLQNGSGWLSFVFVHH